VRADELRAAFPVCEDTAYLNAGTAGPVPAAAVDAAAAELARDAQTGRGGPPHFDRWMELTSRLRQAYASLLGCEPSETAITTGTTEGLARVIAGMALEPGDEILTSDVEHPGLYGPLAAARQRGIAVRMAPLADIANAVGPRTRLVACSHVSWWSGALAPAELADLDIPVLYDGAQALGAIPIDLDALGAAAYAAPGQKWLCGPEGLGALYVRPEFGREVAVSGPGYLNLSEPGRGLDASPWPDARRFDTPAATTHQIAFALAALEVLGGFGWRAVHDRGTSLAAQLAQRLANRGATVTPRDATTLVSWTSDDPPETVRRLAGAGIVVRDLPGTGLVRASVGAWNDEDDLERLLRALRA
jgi:selenocysteine lyase/cysteine desulfurase